MLYRVVIYLAIRSVVAVALRTINPVLDPPSALNFSTRENFQLVRSSLSANPSAVAISTRLDRYTPFYGNGSIADGWPARDTWIAFDHM